MTPVYAELLHAGVTKFKCATVREATVLLEAAAAEQQAGVDLPVAYPHVEPNLSILGALAEAHPEVQLSVLIEGAEDVPAVPAALGIFIDVNIGMDRTGQPDPKEIVSASVAASGSGQLRGLHFCKNTGSYSCFALLPSGLLYLQHGGDTVSALHTIIPGPVKRWNVLDIF
jgi:D-serine deaminase-like pyridoxal phosphate-dependent protein